MKMTHRGSEKVMLIVFWEGWSSLEPTNAWCITFLFMRAERSTQRFPCYIFLKIEKKTTKSQNRNTLLTPHLMVIFVSVKGAETKSFRSILAEIPSGLLLLTCWYYFTCMKSTLSLSLLATVFGVIPGSSLCIPGQNECFDPSLLWDLVSLVVVFNKYLWTLLLCLVSGPGLSYNIEQPLLLSPVMYPMCLKIDKPLIAGKCSVTKYTSLLIKLFGMLVTWLIW